MDVFRATFPAGTVSGAPKIRAMEIIDELEPVRRGTYAGAVGYFGWGGTSMDTAITIRTVLVTGGRAYVQAGAGIVLDSDPPTEYDRYDVTAGAEHRFARVLLRGDVDWTEYDYEGLQDFRDNEETRFSGRVEVDVTPRLDLLLQASVDEFEYANTPTLDSEGQTYLVGVALDGDLVTGEISVGYFERDYEDPTVETFDGLAVAAALEWYITRLTTITFTGRQDAAHRQVRIELPDFGAHGGRERRRIEQRADQKLARRENA